MKKNSILVFALFVCFALGVQAASAQFTITIPKIPKVKKPKTETPPPTTSDAQTERQMTVEEKPPAQNSDCSTDAVMKIFLEDIEKTRKQAEEFRPGLRDYYVSTRSDGKNLYLEAALSPKLRKDWFAQWKENADELSGCVSPALDDLAAVARKTLPTYTGPAGYTLGTPAEKKLILSAITDISNAKVLKVGIKQTDWLIEKDSYNFPTARYRHGMIWAQYPNDVVGYCWVFWINLVQDYAGGGIYGASYGKFISRAVAGCPANAK